MYDILLEKLPKTSALSGADPETVWVGLEFLNEVQEGLVFMLFPRIEGLTPIDDYFLL